MSVNLNKYAAQWGRAEQEQKGSDKAELGKSKGRGGTKNKQKQVFFF